MILTTKFPIHKCLEKDSTENGYIGPPMLCVIKERKSSQFPYTNIMYLTPYYEQYVDEDTKKTVNWYTWSDHHGNVYDDVRSVVVAASHRVVGQLYNFNPDNILFPCLPDKWDVNELYNPTMEEYVEHTGDSDYVEL